MPVPNAPAGQYVPAINPTLNGTRSLTTAVPNEPVAAAPSAVNPTLESGTQVTGVANAPLSQLPSTTSALVNWTPNPGPGAPALATTPVAAESAGILAADGSHVTGSAGPPYVAGNVTVGQNQAGTNVILTPQP